MFQLFPFAMVICIITQNALFYVCSRGREGEGERVKEREDSRMNFGCVPARHRDLLVLDGLRIMLKRQDFVSRCGEILSLVKCKSGINNIHFSFSDNYLLGVSIRIL